MAVARKITKTSRKDSAHKWLKDHYAGEVSQVFERPRIRKDYFVNLDFKKYLKIALIALVVVLAMGSVWFSLRTKAVPKPVEATVPGGWFAVKLLDGELVYGKIDSLTTDPITVNPVYYNYDQAKDASKNTKINEAGDLRLVKRGQETHGPDGALTVFKSQFVYLERLRDDSKVLQAILQNER